VRGLLVRARARLDEDAVTRWRVGARAAEALFVLPFVGTLLVALSTQHSGFFSFLVAEDSVLEWSQVAGFVLGTAFGVLVARRRWRAGERGLACLFFVFAVGCFFLAGEEISWGQRIIGFGTPESLRGANLQEEANLHDVSVARLAFKFVAIAIGLCGALLPWLPYVRTRAKASVVPPLFLTSAFLVLCGYNVGRLVFFPEGFFGGGEKNFVVGRFGEWPELCLAYALAAFAFLSWRALARPRPASG
jgi:hypothetical protein